MGCERIASEGSPVLYTGGGSSSGAAGNFHSRADGAGVIASTDPNNSGGWYYVSNSERGSSNGGGKYQVMTCIAICFHISDIHAIISHSNIIFQSWSNRLQCGWGSY